MAARVQWPLSAGLLALCALIGLLAGSAPGLAIGAGIAVAFAALVAVDLTVGLCAFMVVAFAERLPTAGLSDLTLVKALGALLAVSWLATVATRRAGDRQLFTAHPFMATTGALLLGWMILSVGWAEDPSVARGDIVRYALNLSLLPIVYTAVRRREHVFAVLTVYVAGAVASALYAMFTVDDFEALDRISGLAGTANELASLLVTAMFLAGGLFVALRGSPVLRTLAFAAMAICLIGLFLTQSRAGLVALATALAAAVIMGGRRRFVVATLVTLVTVTTVAYFSFVATDEVRHRVTTFGSGTGRTDIWTVAWRMVENDPIRGVGVGNFQTASIHFLLQPGSILRDEFIVDRPQVTHNSYLQVLAEVGIPGLLLFLGVLAAGFVAAWKAADEFRRRGDPVLEACSRAVTLALIALLVADCFASDQLNKELWLLLGLGPALLAIAQREPG
jgi:O-antigen ligase